MGMGWKAPGRTYPSVDRLSVPYGRYSNFTGPSLPIPLKGKEVLEWEVNDGPVRS